MNFDFDNKYLIWGTMGIVALGVLIGGTMGYFYSDNSNSQSAQNTEQSSDNSTNSQANDQSQASQDADQDVDITDDLNGDYDGEVEVVTKNLTDALGESTYEVEFKYASNSNIDENDENYAIIFSDDDYTLNVGLPPFDLESSVNEFVEVGQNTDSNMISRLTKVQNNGDTLVMYSESAEINEDSCDSSALTPPCSSSTVNLDDQNGRTAIFNFVCEAETDEGLEKCDTVALNTDLIGVENIGEDDGVNETETTNSNDKETRTAIFPKPIEEPQKTELTYQVDKTAEITEPDPDEEGYMTNELVIEDEGYRLDISFFYEGGVSEYDSEPVEVGTSNLSVELMRYYNEMENDDNHYKYINSISYTSGQDCTSPRGSGDVEAPCGLSNLFFAHKEDPTDKYLIMTQCYADANTVEKCDEIMKSLRIVE